MRVKSGLYPFKQMHSFLSVMHWLWVVIFPGRPCSSHVLRNLNANSFTNEDAFPKKKLSGEIFACQCCVNIAQNKLVMPLPDICKQQIITVIVSCGLQNPKHYFAISKLFYFLNVRFTFVVTRLFLNSNMK